MDNIAPTRERSFSQVIRCFRCGSLCRARQCFAWSWVPEERQCTHYNSFISSSLTYTPNPSVHTYVTLAPAPDLEYLVFKGKRMSWRQAQETCSGVGAVLAYRRDFQWLKSLQRLHDVEGFFLGLTKVFQCSFFRGFQCYFFVVFSVPFQVVFSIIFS